MIPRGDAVSSVFLDLPAEAASSRRRGDPSRESAGLCRIALRTGVPDDGAYRYLSDGWPRRIAPPQRR